MDDYVVNGVIASAATPWISTDKSPSVDLPNGDERLAPVLGY